MVCGLGDIGLDIFKLPLEILDCIRECSVSGLPSGEVVGIYYSTLDFRVALASIVFVTATLYYAVACERF